MVAEEIRKRAENSAENSRLINQFLQESVNQVMEVSPSFATTTEAFSREEETFRSVIQGFEHIRHTVEELTLGTREMTGAFISIKDSVSQINEYSGILDQSCADLETHSEASVELKRGYPGGNGSGGESDRPDRFHQTADGRFSRFRRSLTDRFH